MTATGEPPLAQAWTDAAGVASVASCVAAGGVLVLSGAGLSTESGIPDYRGPTGAARRHGPMTYQAFVGDPAARRRYWARSYVGWSVIASARPNDGHRAVTELQLRGLLDAIVTQNVDGLHQAAGAQEVIELHGGLDQVVCLSCGDRTTRLDLDARLREANPDFEPERLAAMRADGDAELADEVLTTFQPVDCTGCGGLLKPDLVFFGESVPHDRVERCYALVAAARSILVLGSSLTVMSGLRFVRRAAQLEIPIAMINQGPTRADDLVDVRVDAPLGTALRTVLAAL